MANLYFPFEAVDPRRNAEYSRRAYALRTPTRNETGGLDAAEWLCRLFYFAPSEEDDIVISVSGTGGVVASEMRWYSGDPADGPERKTERLDHVAGSVFRDRVLRIDPWTHEPDSSTGGVQRWVMEFIESEKYACLAADQVPSHSPVHELLVGFCALWPERAARCHEHLHSPT